MNSELIKDIDNIIQELQNLRSKINLPSPIPSSEKPGWMKQGRFTYRFSPKNGGRRTRRKK